MSDILVTALANTLNNNGEVRKSGEEVLKIQSKNENYGFELLNIARWESHDGSIRLAAATNLKNYIKYIWKEEGGTELSEAKRRELRSRLYEVMLQSQTLLANLFCEAICIISKYDFPESWPELIDMIVNGIAGNADNNAPLMSILKTLDGICLKYRSESKSDILWSEIKLVLDKAASPLTELFQLYVGYVQQFPDRLNECVDVLVKVISIYRSVLTQELPEVFEDSMNVWMPGFHTLYQLSESASNVQPALDNLWDEMTVVVTHYAQRFEEEILPYMERFVELIWKALIFMVSTNKKSEFAKSGINFLATLAFRPQYQSAFEADGVLQTLLNSIVLPNMVFTDDDIEMLDDEPVSFFKQDLDGFDKDTLRGASANFLRTLCIRYEQRVVNIITPVITAQMERYQASPQNHWREMDAVCSIILAICSKTETQKYGATTVSTLIDVNDFCRSLIIPELTKPTVIPLVVANCLKFFVTFRNQLESGLIVQFFNGQLAVRFLNPSSNETPVLRLYAAHAVERLLSTPLISRERVNMNDLFVQFAGLLIDDLSLPMGIDNCYIMKCLYKCISYMNNETLSHKCLAYTSVVSQVLEAALKHTAQVDSLAVHYIFEIICWFIKKSYILPAGSVSQFYHSAVLPIITGLFESENRDYVPYGLQLICALLEQYGHEKEHDPNLQIPTNDFEALYTKLLESDIWQSSVNVPAFVSAVRSYLRWLPMFVLSGNLVNAMMKLTARFISSKVNHQNGFLLANELLKYCDRVEGVTSKDIFMPILQRLTTGKEARFLRNVFVFWMRYIAVRGPRQFEQVLEGIQAGCFSMAYNNVLLIEASKDIRYMTTTSEKRSIIFGIIHLFRGNYVTPETAERWIVMGVRLIDAFYAVKNTTVDENEDISVMETADQFNKLANVQLPESIGNADIDFRKHFVRVVYAYITGTQQQPTLPNEIASSLNNLKNAAFPGIDPPTTNWDDLDSQLLQLGQ